MVLIFTKSSGLLGSMHNNKAVFFRNINRVYLVSSIQKPKHKFKCIMVRNSEENHTHKNLLNVFFSVILYSIFKLKKNAI